MPMSFFLIYMLIIWHFKAFEKTHSEMEPPVLGIMIVQKMTPNLILWVILMLTGLCKLTGCPISEVDF